MQIPVHDLGDNVKPPGGGIPIKQNAQADADGKNITDHVKGRVPG